MGEDEYVAQRAPMIYSTKKWTVFYYLTSRALIVEKYKRILRTWEFPGYLNALGYPVHTSRDQVEVPVLAERESVGQEEVKTLRGRPAIRGSDDPKVGAVRGLSVFVQRTLA